MMAGAAASEGQPAIKGLSPQILQSLFAHALQFVPESNEALSFTSIYFSGLPSSSHEQQQQQTQKTQSIPLHAQLNPLPKTQNGSTISQRIGGGSGVGQEQALSGTQPKRVMLTKMSNANQPILEKEQPKHAQKQSNKLTPILRGSLVPLTSEGRRKIQSRQDPFNQVKDGFFSPQEHGFSLTSSTQFNPANNKNTRSTSNLPGSGGGGGGGGRMQPLDSLSNNINGSQNLQNHYFYGNNLNNNNNDHHQNSQILEDEEFNSSMEQNPYAMGWANNVLKEQFSVALRQVDEKNGRKKWIIRKVKFDKIGNQTHYSSGLHSASAYPLTKHAEGTNNSNGNNQPGKNTQVESRHKSNNIRRLQKRPNKDKSSNTRSEIFTRLVIAKQKKIIADSSPELIDLKDLSATMNLNPRLIAGNILSHTTIFKNGRQQAQQSISIDSLTPSCVQIMEKAYQLPIFNRNFKFNIEKTAFLNKILIASL